MKARKTVAGVLALTLVLHLPLISVSAETLAERFASTGYAVVETTSGMITGQCGDRLTFVFDEATGMLMIIGEGEMWDFTDGHAPWTAVAERVTRVVVAEGVTHIGSYSFSGCVKLETVDMPQSMETIGTQAFSKCEAIQTVSYAGSEAEWQKIAMEVISSGLADRGN